MESFTTDTGIHRERFRKKTININILSLFVLQK